MKRLPPAKRKEIIDRHLTKHIQSWTCRYGLANTLRLLEDLKRRIKPRVDHLKAHRQKLEEQDAPHQPLSTPTQDIFHPPRKTRPPETSP